MHASASACPHCGSVRITAFSARACDIDAADAQIAVRHCLDCDFAWQFPRFRSAKQSAAFFQASYSAGKNSAATKTAATGTAYFDPQRRAAVAAIQCELLQAVAPQPARLLDIGAGDGTFIQQAAQRGWSCTGIDPAATEQQLSS